MKRGILWATLICSAYFMQAQHITISFSVGDMPVINGTQCDLTSSAKVYIHAGVSSTATETFTHETGNWGQDDGLGLMTDDGSGGYSITLNLQGHFTTLNTNGDPWDQAAGLNNLAFVFRNEDGTEEGKPFDCSFEDKFIITEFAPGNLVVKSFLNDVVVNYVSATLDYPIGISIPSPEEFAILPNLGAAGSEFLLSHSAAQLDISFYNLIGEEMNWEITDNGNSSSVTVPQQAASGVYFVRFREENGNVITRRLIIK